MRDDKLIISKDGEVTVEKGLKAGNTYKVKVAVKAAGDKTYAEKTVTKTFKIKVKAAASDKAQGATSGSQLTTANAQGGL